LYRNCHDCMALLKRMIRSCSKLSVNRRGKE
jgi:hypothetical protein